MSPTVYLIFENCCCWTSSSRCSENRIKTITNETADTRITVLEKKSNILFLIFTLNIYELKEMSYELIFFDVIMELRIIFNNYVQSKRNLSYFDFVINSVSLKSSIQYNVSSHSFCAMPNL